MSALTQEELRRLLHYNPDTGEFHRLVAVSNVEAGALCGSKDRDGYVLMFINGKRYKAHRLAFLYMTGDFPPKHTDHINGNPADNRWSNLRAVSNAENHRNRRITDANNSGVLGVFLAKGRGVWHAQIQVNGRKHHLGSFPSLSDAISARKNAEIKYGFHPNHGRKTT